MNSLAWSGLQRPSRCLAAKARARAMWARAKVFGVRFRQTLFVRLCICAWYDNIVVITMQCNVTFLDANSRAVCLCGCFAIVI